MEPPQFPAGEYTAPDWTPAVKADCLAQLAEVPRLVRESVTGLTEEQLDTKYRNWTIRQIVHHLADSHINCYVRFKWALTEETPHIKSYRETQWSQVVDARSAPLDCSLGLLDGLHSRWCELVKRLDEEQIARGFFHPELSRVVTLAEALPNYVWHSHHHLAQIAWVRKQHGWN